MLEKKKIKTEQIKRNPPKVFKNFKWFETVKISKRQNFIKFYGFASEFYTHMFIKSDLKSKLCTF